MSKFEQYIDYMDQKLSFLVKGNSKVYKFINNQSMSLSELNNNNFFIDFVIVSLVKFYSDNNIEISGLNSDSITKIEKAKSTMFADYVKIYFEYMKKECNISGYLDKETLQLLLYKEPYLRNKMVEIFGEKIINEGLFPSAEITGEELNVVKKAYKYLIQKRHIEEFSNEEVKEKYIEKLQLGEKLEEANDIKSKLEVLEEDRYLKLIINDFKNKFKKNNAGKRIKIFKELTPDEVKQEYVINLKLNEKIKMLKDLKEKNGNSENYHFFDSMIKDLEDKLKEILECNDEIKIEDYRSQLIPEEALKYEADYLDYITINNLLAQKKYYEDKLESIEEFMQSDILEEFKKSYVEAGSHISASNALEKALDEKYGHIHGFLHDGQFQGGVQVTSLEEKISIAGRIERQEIEEVEESYGYSYFLKPFKKRKIQKIQKNGEISKLLSAYYVSKGKYKKSLDAAYQIIARFSAKDDPVSEEVLSHYNQYTFVHDCLSLQHFIDDLKRGYTAKYNEVLKQLNDYHMRDENVSYTYINENENYYSSVKKAVELFEEDYPRK